MTKKITKIDRLAKGGTNKTHFSPAYSWIEILMIDQDAFISISAFFFTLHWQLLRYDKNISF